MFACKVLWEPFQHGSDSAVLLKMFCAICGFTLPVNLAEGSESVVADSALSTQLKEDDGLVESIRNPRTLLGRRTILK